ncbi:MAG TPA: OmpA family protein [Bryobacteraceae bacterium]|nr:OmpA family protein [Bryobacteraceae bacterium]
MFRLTPILLLGGALCAQAPQNAPPAAAPVPNDAPQPIFRVTVVEKTTNAISYRHRDGWTKVDLHGTALAPDANGHADVNSRPGYIEAKTEMHKLLPASQYGPEYLTYVLWAITPEGRSKNLGEVVLDDGGSSHLDVTTDLQAFALIVTAEPYFGVTQPSDVVVMENVVRQDTVGKIEQMSVKYDLLKRGTYTMTASPGKFHAVKVDKRVPLQLFEAQNALEIARSANADTYAKDTFDNAADLLRQAEAYQGRKEVGSKPVIMTARESVQASETSRLLALKRQEDDRIAREKKEAADREAAARAQADEAARQKALADAQAAESARQAEAQARRAAEEKAAAEVARANEEAERLRAQQAKVAADEQQRQAEQARLLQQQAELKAQEAERLRQQAEQAQQQLRQQLLEQFNLILETRDTARGLIVNMSDVLFDFNKYTLRPAAREKLAKISGIILSHPGLRLEVDGYTDSVGSDDYNMKLSEQRAGAVRDYLTGQGLARENVSALGFGKENPVASNDTSAGRQKNRRVEMVVSGDIIGTPIGSTSSLKK